MRSRSAASIFETISFVSKGQMILHRVRIVNSAISADKKRYGFFNLPD
ncbi:hypothetical protein [Bacillus sp. V2I10]|nr:hypothetical protein [Bacillus sp. V2I10]MDQ0860949.1 putative nucleic acid-binding protein [Bacillus sp. V2I10]